MRHAHGLAVLAGAAALAGCATQAPAPFAAQHPLPARPPAPAAPPAVTAKDTIPFGYQRVVLENGEERFCRNDLDVGSRVARTKVCYTAKQLKDSEDSTQNFMNKLQEHGVGASRTCTPGPGCN